MVTRGKARSPSLREAAIPRLQSSTATGRLVLTSRPRSSNRTIRTVACLLAVAACLAIAGIPELSAPAAAQAPDSTPVPYMDERLTIPVLPDSPTLIELGSYSYYYNCMPCHGDQGQGLTDEFRGIWPEDHQYCWGRGCHAGHPGDEGFPIPHFIPAIIGLPRPLARFTSAQDLETYLRETHPPQRPGVLSGQEYRALTAYLLAANGRAAEIPTSGGTATSVLVATAVLLGGVLSGAWLAARLSRPVPGQGDAPDGGDTP